jgi:hypothetical protein
MFPKATRKYISKNAICSICGKEVVLYPSANERAKKCGGTAQDYINMFPNHSECVIAKRNTDTSELMKRLKAEPKKYITLSYK